jgi:Tol biopolymer transport system component
MNATPTQSESDSLSEITQLTTGFAAAGEAYFSRDMKWIIFQAKRNNNEHYQMYLSRVKYDPNGSIEGISQPFRISPEGTWNSCGDFSPDANTLIFSSTAGKQTPDVPATGPSYQWLFPEGAEIFRADGWQGAVSALAPGGDVNLAQHPLTNNDFYDAENAFSPDGQWIIFTSNRSGDLEIWAMRSDGKDPVQLTHAPGYDGGPFFSPDARRIVFRGDRQNNRLLQIFVADLIFGSGGKIVGATNEQQLTHDASVNWCPFWHPDGKHLIWSTSRHGFANFELYLMRADGTHKTRITFSSGADILPVFSPDGNYVMWSAKRDGKTVQIYLAKFHMPHGA